MADIAGTITAGVRIAEGSVDLIDRLCSKIGDHARLKRDSATFLRLLYLETVNNLEVLSLIRIESLRGKPPNCDALKNALRMLHTDVAESVFAGADESPNTELYEKLKKRGKVKNRNRMLRTQENGTEKQVTAGFIYENILQAVSFVVVKIDLLRKLSSLSDTELECLKATRPDVRLVNIHQRLLMVKHALDSFEEVKDMAR